MLADQKPNLDPAEISRFNNLADDWWNPEGPFKPLHDINPQRANYINSKTSLVDQNILDVGCGGGLLCEALSRRGAFVTGIDMSEKALTVARHHAGLSSLNIQYHQTTAEQWAAQHPKQYDCVTCLEMLEHVPDPEAVIRACAVLVKPEGHIFFSTINRNPKSFLFAIVGAEHVLKMIPKGTHEFAKFIRPSELSLWLREAGLELREIRGLAYNPFTRHCKLTSNVSVNYFIHAVKS